MSTTTWPNRVVAPAAVASLVHENSCGRRTLENLDSSGRAGDPITTRLSYPIREDFERLLGALDSGERVAGLTHPLYRYPARFSPAFARAAIRAFSEPGDLVMDPFVGGGTTMVEALALGRATVGSDINELAVFVSRAKTTLLSSTEASRLAQWGARLDAVTTLRWHTTLADTRRQVDSRVPWNIKRSLQLAVENAMDLKSGRVKRLARATLLRLGQWALDGRREVPNRRQFIAKHAQILSDCIRGSLQLGALAQGAFGVTRAKAESQRRVYRGAAESLNRANVLAVGDAEPRLILTSPPYHGIHMLYHRWQVEGRRETNAPYWLSGCNDGRAASYYTFGSRSREKDAHIREEYFENALRSFRGVRSVCDERTYVVQLVGFSNPTLQLTRYSEMMAQAGFDEVRIGKSRAEIVRRVPNRKWYLEALRRFAPSEREFLLVHRAKG